MASKLSPEQRAQYRRLARDGEAGAYAQEARRHLIEDGQSFTVYPHKVASKPPTTTTTRNPQPTAAGRAALARAKARKGR